jgi:hypothetical protein
MARQRLGPISKQIEEAFPFFVNLSKVLPDGETFDAPSSSLSSVLKSTGADSTTDLFGGPTPTVLVNGALVGGDLPVHGAGVINRHLISLDAMTDVGSKFEVEVDIDVVEYREAIHFVDKSLPEVFPLGIDFDSELETGETITSASTKSVEKADTTNDTTADLINGAAQINGTVVSANLKAGAPAQKDRHVVQLTAITDQGRRFSDQIEVVVED